MNELTDLVPTLTNPRTLNWRERLDWWIWRLLQRAKRALIGDPRRGKAAVEYTTNIFGENYPDITHRPEAEVSLEYDAPRGSAISLKILYHCHDDGQPIHFTDALITFNVDPDAVPEDELVLIGMKGKEDYLMDLSEILAAGIGWEMTTWAVFKLFDLDTAEMFDQMIMYKELKQEWFLPVPEEALIV